MIGEIAGKVVREMVKAEVAAQLAGHDKGYERHLVDTEQRFAHLQKAVRAATADLEIHRKAYAKYVDTVKQDSRSSGAVAAGHDQRITVLEARLGRIINNLKDAFEGQ